MDGDRDGESTDDDTMMEINWEVDSSDGAVGHLSEHMAVPRPPSLYSTLESTQSISLDEIISGVDTMSLHGGDRAHGPAAFSSCGSTGGGDPPWRGRMEALTVRDLLDLQRQVVLKAGIWVAQVGMSDGDLVWCQPPPV